MGKGSQSRHPRGGSYSEVAAAATWRSQPVEAVRRIPPRPPSLPVLGSVVWLTNSPSDVEPLLRCLFTQYGPIVSLCIGSRRAIFIADRHLAHTALVERGAALANRPVLASARLLGESDNIISRASYGPVWCLLRLNLCSEFMDAGTDTTSTGL